MKKTQITVRDVDAEAFKEFKADTVKKGMKLGSALTIAMEKFRSEIRGKKFRFTNHKPTSYGKGTERISEEVDEILYG